MSVCCSPGRGWKVATKEFTSFSLTLLPLMFYLSFIFISSTLRFLLCVYLLLLLLYYVCFLLIAFNIIIVIISFLHFYYYDFVCFVYFIIIFHKQKRKKNYFSFFSCLLRCFSIAHMFTHSKKEKKRTVKIYRWGDELRIKIDLK